MGQFDVTACAASHSADSIRSMMSSMLQRRSVIFGPSAGYRNGRLRTRPDSITTTSG